MVIHFTQFKQCISPQFNKRSNKNVGKNQWPNNHLYLFHYLKSCDQEKSESQFLLIQLSPWLVFLWLVVIERMWIDFWKYWKKLERNEALEKSLKKRCYHLLTSTFSKDLKINEHSFWLLQIRKEDLWDGITTIITHN